MDLDYGEIIGQYYIIGQIGKGGMTTVYKAHQPNLDRYVAIKVLTPDLAESKGFIARFEREARAAAKLRHRNILTVFDYGRRGDLFYLVMEYVSGGTLIGRLGWPQDLAYAVNIVSQVGDALAHAHMQGMIHRDVKPGNILMAEEDWPLLSDFGLAKMVEDSPKLTASGASVGTPQYMSPEQAQGLAVDRRSDIYSLGAVLYETVTGRPPFGTDAPMAVILGHINEPITPPHALRSDLPEEIERVILKALAKSPADRYQRMEEFLADLQEAYPLPTNRTYPSVPLTRGREERGGNVQAASEIKQVFISYATADTQFAHRLADDLQRLGAQVWIAPESIRPSGDWVDAIERGLEESSQVVVVLTPAARESRWVKKETNIAIALERKGLIQVIPLDVEPCEVPLLLSSYQMVTFRRDYDAGLSQLSAILGVHVAPPELVRHLRSESDEYGIQYGSEVAQILRRYEGKRIKANREDKPDQYFVHKRMLHLLDVAAARVCGERIGPFEDLDSNEEFILDIKEIKGSPYSRLKMIEVLDRIEAEEIEKAEERLITISSLKQESITSTGLPFEPEMVRIPAGRFLMGTLEEDLWAIARKYSIKRKYIAREIPRHKVFVQEFEICKYPVTNFQYQAFVQDTGREPPGHWKGDKYPEELRDHPVVNVSWYDAVDYCKWLSEKTGKSCRLPTEAEWEKAARGTDRREFPWGNEWDMRKCNTREGGPGTTTPVGQYSPHGDSSYGVVDMAGNVWEWCTDWLDAYKDNPFPDEDYGETYKVLRGGSWDHGQVGTRCAYRNWFEPRNRVEDVGFRYVRGSQ